MTDRINSLDNRYSEITESITNLYSWIHVLKSYTEDKADKNQEVANADIMLGVIIHEIDALVSYI